MTKPASIPDRHDRFFKTFIYSTLILMLALLVITLVINYKTQKLMQGVTTKPIAQIGEAANKLECLAKGGVWQKWGLAGQEFCQIPALDAGKKCTDGSQCSYGICMSENNSLPGACTKFKTNFGCYSKIENGKISSSLCVD